MLCECAVGWGFGDGQGRYRLNPLAAKNPHRRFNPLKREWVLVSPNRTQRPWQGQMEKPVVPAALRYDQFFIPVMMVGEGWGGGGGVQNILSTIL